MLGLARHLTLRQRLVALVAVAVVPSAVALGSFIAAWHREHERDVRAQALRTSQIVALEMERIVTGAEGVLETVALAPSVRFLTRDCDSYLEEIVARLPQLSGFAVADLAGRVRCAAGIGFGPGGVAGEPWFRAALTEQEFVVGEYTRSVSDDRAYLPLALPIGAGTSGQVVLTGIDLGWLGARIRERNLAQGTALVIADRNGTMIAREPDPQRVGTRITANYLSLTTATRAGTLEIVGQDNVRRILGFQPPAVTGIGLYVGASISTEVAFAPVYASTRRAVVLAGVGAFAACAFAWLVGDRLFVRPIQRIVATVESWRAGDVGARTGIVAEGSELAVLAATIDEYMDNLALVRAERAAADERRSLVLREMNHRIKNILSAVQAIANQTLKGGASPAGLEVFGSRLTAMAAAHDLLVNDNWESADLRRTLAAALKPFGFEHHRFSLEGPPVQITAKAALALSMALHELCTNAAKYGALKTGTGAVSIAWRLVQSPTGERLHLVWTERGGPPVAEPTHRGFGTRLIQAALASELSAEATLEFRETGVVFILDADAEHVVADAEAATGNAA